MDQFNDDNLGKLCKLQSRPCVSMFVPTHRNAHKGGDDPVRLKNHLQDAQEALRRREMKQQQIDKLLKPAQDLVADREFWRQQRDGLAIFLTPESDHRFRVPHVFTDKLVIDGRAYVIPLFPVLTDDERFFILALSGNQVRLLDATQDTVQEVDVPGLISSFEELDKFIDAEKQLQFHTETARAVGERTRPAVFHGQGVGKDDKRIKKDLLEYCHLVDRGLLDTLREAQVPLVLACDEALWPLYREANSYDLLVDEPVRGNMEHLSDEQARDRVWPVIERRVLGRREQALERFHDAKGQNAGVDDLDQVLSMVTDGRIATLFVNREAEAWGQFDAAQRRAVVHGTAGPEDEELLNYAAARTFEQGGQVFALKSEQMPTGSPAAAVLRY